jgi:hypothetical protein
MAGLLPEEEMNDHALTLKLLLRLARSAEVACARRVHEYGEPSR